MNHDDERTNLLFNLFKRFCVTVLAIIALGIAFYVWMTFKK